MFNKDCPMGEYWDQARIRCDPKGPCHRSTTTAASATTVKATTVKATKSSTEKNTPKPELPTTKRPTPKCEGRLLTSVI